MSFSSSSSPPSSSSSSRSPPLASFDGSVGSPPSSPGLLSSLDLSIILDDEDLPPPSLSLDSLIECGICCDYLNDPRETNCCHSLFCVECFKMWTAGNNTCPNCRARNPNTKENIPVHRFIESMPVCCPYKMEGCKSHVARSELETHKKNCVYRPEKFAEQRKKKIQRIMNDLSSYQKLNRLNNRALKEVISLAKKLMEEMAFPEALVASELAGCPKEMQKFCDRVRSWPEMERNATFLLFGKILFENSYLEDALSLCHPALEEVKQSMEDIDLLLQLSIMTANILLKLSRYDESETIYKETQRLVGEKKRKGNQVNYDKKLFAELMCASGVLAKKRSKFQEATSAYTKAMSLLSKSDPEWPQLLLNLADTKRKVGKHSEALKLYQEALSIVEKRNGRNNHPLIADICNALGVLEKKHGRYGVALDMYSQSLRVGRHFHGETYSNNGVILTNIGDIYRKKGEYARAEVMYQSALTQLESTFGAEHIEVADALNSLGLVNKKKAHYDEAKEFYERALSIAQKSFSDLHYKKGIYLANLGDVHRKVAAFERALECYDESLKNIEGTMGHDNSEVADVLHSSGLVKHQLEQYSESVKLYDEALSLVTKEFGERHYKCGMYLCNKGLALAMLNNYDDAYDCLLKSLSILRSDLGPSHVEVGDVHAAIADVCLKIAVEKAGEGASKKIGEAERHVKDALGIAKTAFGDSHTKTQQYESLLFICENYSSL